MPTSKTISTNGTNPQLQSAIERILPKAVAQRESKILARKLKGANDYATSRNIFNWVLTNIKYKQDGVSQVIKLPSALLIVKEGDCKSMALLTASLLLKEADGSFFGLLMQENSFAIFSIFKLKFYY